MNQLVVSFTVLVLATACVVSGHMNPSAFNQGARMYADQGSFQPCSPSDPKFTLTWTPSLVKVGETLSISFEMTPTVDWDSGTYNLTVWLPNYDDPIFQQTDDADCSIVHQVFPHICPFKKGGKISVPGYKFYVSPNLPLPGGTFTIQAELKNKRGQMFMCMKGIIRTSSGY